MLHKQGMRDAFESVWGLGLGMDADWRSSVLESVIGKNPLVWRNETFLNRVMASYVATLDLRVTVRLRVPLAGGEFFGVDAWEGVAGEWDIPYPLSVVLSGDIWGLVARIGAFILQVRTSQVRLNVLADSCCRRSRMPKSLQPTSTG